MRDSAVRNMLFLLATLRNSQNDRLYASAAIKNKDVGAKRLVTESDCDKIRLHQRYSLMLELQESVARVCQRQLGFLVFVVISSKSL